MPRDTQVADSHCIQSHAKQGLSHFCIRPQSESAQESVQIFTLGGSFSGEREADKGGEVFNPSTNGPWTETTNIEGAVINSDDPQGMFRTDNYGFFFAWTGNSGEFLFQAAPPFVGHGLIVNSCFHGVHACRIYTHTACMCELSMLCDLFPSNAAHMHYDLLRFIVLRSVHALMHNSVRYCLKLSMVM